MDEEKQGVGNPFDAPVPGQSLTDTPGNYPWEHPPQFTDPEEATEFIWQTLHTEEFMEQVIGMLDAGVPIEAIARVIVFGGFVEGKFTPDVGFLITEPVMKMLMAIGVRAGLNNIRMSMQDITNSKQMSDIAKIKLSKKDFEKSVSAVESDVKKAGLMSKPEIQEEN
jgi:hypothetical protein|tara:strand:- start:1592 stop:2092 length:501 start_codon:yes stop_codon:yes gene_type:complete